MESLKKKPNPPTMKLYDDPAAEERHLGGARIEPGRDRLGARRTGDMAGLGRFRGSAGPRWRLSPRPAQALFASMATTRPLYGHLGQGCIHCRVEFDLRTAEGLDNYRSFMDEATSLVVSYGGSLSGEHGDGQARAQFLPKMFGEEIVQAFREFKAIWDPEWKMNPGKVVDPYGITDNLRLGTNYNPPQLETHFQFPDDHGSFAHAALRCVGVGKCRREEGGTMCPSYMVTREEEHSTRGRARLLFEMLHGDPLTGGLAQRSGSRRAGTLPGLQRVQRRLSGQRGHGHLQGGVPVALLRGPAPPAARLFDGPDLLVGAAGVARAAAGELRWVTRRC